MTALLAKQEFGVPRVLARVNHPGNEWLFNEQWGVDTAVSPPHILTAMVEEAVTTGDLVRLLKLEGGSIHRRAEADPGSPATGRPLYEIRMPTDSTIVAVLRDGHVVIPQPETVLVAGDELVALPARAPTTRCGQRSSATDLLGRLKLVPAPAIPEPGSVPITCGRRGIGLELAPQLAHEHSQRLHVGRCLRVPHVAEEPVVGPQHPRRRRQRLQQPPLGGRQVHGRIAADNGARRDIDDQIFGHEPRARRLRRRPTQQRTDPRQELPAPNGFVR